MTSAICAVLRENWRNQLTGINCQSHSLRSLRRTVLLLVDHMSEKRILREVRERSYPCNAEHHESDYEKRGLHYRQSSRNTATRATNNVATALKPERSTVANPRKRCRSSGVSEYRDDVSMPKLCRM